MMRTIKVLEDCCTAQHNVTAQQGYAMLLLCTQFRIGFATCIEVWHGCPVEDN